MESKVWSFITKEELIRERQKVGAAVSGGSDSMALLLCLHSLSKNHDFTLCAVHVDHAIRGAESKKDAAFVQRRCQQLGIPLFLREVDVPALAKEKHVGLEFAGREAREAFFQELQQNGSLDVVATAHHQEDNAESVLMHVMRGCGLDGLTGIAPSRGALIRPFLCLSKEEILSYLEQKGEDWCQDASNLDIQYTRNFVRHSIMPRMQQVNPQIISSLNRLSSLASLDAAYLETQAKSAAQRLLQGTGGTVRISVADLRKEDPALVSRILLYALNRLGRDKNVEQAHVQSIVSLLDGRTGSRTDIGEHICARLEYGELVLSDTEKEQRAFIPETAIKSGKNVLANGDELDLDDVCERGQSSAFREYVDADKLPAGLIVRSRRPGDVIHPLHGPGRKKLKDYFIDLKLPRQLRDEVPLVTQGSRVLWVVGHIISEDVCVDAKTKSICRLTYVPARRNDGTALR